MLCVQVCDGYALTVKYSLPCNGSVFREHDGLTYILSWVLLSTYGINSKQEPLNADKHVDEVYEREVVMAVELWHSQAVGLIAHSKTLLKLP